MSDDRMTNKIDPEAQRIVYSMRENVCRIERINAVLTEEQSAKFRIDEDGDAVSGQEPGDDDLEEYELLVEGWPPSLVMAVSDPFMYALQLRDGTRIWFDSALPLYRSITGSDDDSLLPWVLLNDARLTPEPDPNGFTFDRGLEVLVDNIVWCCKAPYGS